MLRRGRTPMKRTRMKPGRRRVGAAARARIRAGGVLAKGRPSLSLSAYLALKAMKIEMAGGCCLACHQRACLPIDLDHGIDRSKGGGDSWEGTLPLGRKCHELKKAPFAKVRLLTVALGAGVFRLDWVTGTKAAHAVLKTRVVGRAPTAREQALLGLLR